MIQAIIITVVVNLMVVVNIIMVGVVVLGTEVVFKVLFTPRLLAKSMRIPSRVYHVLVVCQTQRISRLLQIQILLNLELAVPVESVA